MGPVRALSVLTPVVTRLAAFAAACVIITAVCFVPYGFDVQTWGAWEGFQWPQYWEHVSQFIAGLARGDLGRTVTGAAVAGEIARVAPRSLLLLAVSLGWAIGCGFLAGTLAVASGRRAARTRLLAGTFLALSLPDFFIIVVVQSVILVGFRSLGLLIIPALGSPTPRGLVLPALTLGALPAAYVARVVTVALEEVERADFMRTAIAKGRSRLEAVVFHALRNACASAVAALPSVYGIAVSSLIIVEYLCVYPGLGNLAINAFVRHRYYGPDCGLLPAIGFVFAGSYFALDAVAAIGRSWIDPRFREGVQR